MQLESLYLKIDSKQFHFLKFILEGYDGIATLSSYDTEMGIIVLRYPETNRRDLIALLSSLAKRLSPFPTF